MTQLIQNSFDFATGLQGLTNLANWLEAEERWRNKFLVWDFTGIITSYDRHYHEVREDQREAAQHCGSAGCGLGLAITVWPEFKNAARYEYASEFDTASRTFGITKDETDLLFGGGFLNYSGVPGNLPPAGSRAMKDVTPGRLAEEIRKFIALKIGEAQ